MIEAGLSAADTTRVVCEAQLIVRRKGDESTVVDRHDRPLGRRHDPERSIQVALLQGGDLVVEEGKGIAHDVQSMMTLPESPARAAVNAASWSRNPKRWVMAGVMSRPDWSMTVILYQVSYISRP